MSPDTVNGIDVGKLRQTVQDISAHPELGKFTFRAANQWVQGTNNRAQVLGFYGAGQEHPDRAGRMVYEEDEPPILMGSDKGANPVEFVLVGLSGCLTTSLVAVASMKGINLRSVESKLEGHLDVRGFLGVDDSVRKGFQDISVTFAIDADATDEQIRELVEGAKSLSPVYDIVTGKVPVDVRGVRA